MILVAIGLNHRTAPIDLRERVARGIANSAEALQELQQRGLTKEVALLSTCNRVEIYGVLSDDNSLTSLLEWLGERGDFSMVNVKQHFYTFQGKDVLHHLFRVVSSLDSMILGENQIVSQIREAYRNALRERSIGPVLRRSIDRALVVAKRVRTETDISKEGVSIGRAGVDLAVQVLGDLSGRSALLIGAGEHGKMVAKNLITRRLKTLVIANRTPSRAQQLAQELTATAIELDEIPEWIAKVDIVITSVGGGEVLVTKENVKRSFKPRGYKPLVAIDLSIPRVIDPEVHSLDDAYLFDIDDLDQLARNGAQKRTKEAVLAEKIVESETSQCWKMLQDDKYNADIGSVFRQAEVMRAAEIQRLFEDMNGVSEEEKRLVDRMSKSLIKRMLHNPMQVAHHLAREEDNEKLHFLLTSFLRGKDD